jgi:hypothetical protein
MSIRITQDANQPMATVEWMIQRPLPDFDLDSVEAPVPRDVDPILASQGFKDLLDEARAILESELAESRLEIIQLTGAICPDGIVFRPGIWLVAREIAAAPSQPISSGARSRLTQAAEIVRSRLGLS